jgi:hypothetical protein
MKDLRMENGSIKRVVVVLSAGRSGTSLLMKALAALGLRLSEKMIPGSVNNPEGLVEDAEIVEVHKELLDNLNARPFLPLPEGWVQSDAVKKARPKLKEILEDRLGEAVGLWGFKDPRTASFLPLWNWILNGPGTVPIFLLGVRNPAAVAVSLRRQINREESISELQWLQRTTDALHHTGADCYIVHYEDWFTRPNELAQELCRYTGLDKYFNGSVEEALKDVIKPNLNRAVYEDYFIQNEYVLKLYDMLKDCRGDDFDRAKLMAVVKACRRAMDGFKGWYMEAQKYVRGGKDLRSRTSAMEADLEKMVLENNRLLTESKDRFDEAEDLRKRLNTLEQSSKKQQGEATQGKWLVSNDVGNVSKWRNEAIVLKYSYSFRLGQILINGFSKPGKNTVLMPFYLASLAWDMISGRGREKVRNALEGGL